MKLLAATAWGVIFLFISSEAYAITKILGLRYWSAPDHTRIVIDLTAPPSYEPCAPPDPQTLAWWIKGAVFPARVKTLAINDRVVQSVALEVKPSRRVQVAVILAQPAEARVFPLKKYLDKPDRLVIDLLRPDLEGKEKEKRQAVKALKVKKIRIVVIDPGHGGEDPGAIGPKGTREKDIVLELGKKLKKILAREGDIQAYLTREGDYFLPLADRVRIAREYGADLFISLHCNGHRKRHLRGTSIYCLSLKGASDVASRLLAKQENASDKIGGVFTDAAPAWVLDSILVDLQQTNAINASLRLGGMVLGEFQQVNIIQFERPRQAEFAVLKAPDFPSILVECAYLTNPKEEFLLKNEKFQDRVVRALAESLKKFLATLVVQEGKTNRVRKNYGTEDHHPLR